MVDPPSYPGRAPETIAWHTLEHLEVCQVLQVTPETGLSETEAARRREEFGSNEVFTPRQKSLLWRLPEQIAGPLVLLLLACSLASFWMDRIVEGVALLLVALLNVLPALTLEIQSMRSTANRPPIPEPRFARVRRSGVMRLVHPRDLVPGDVIHLGAGDVVPADARLIGSVNLLAQEGPLTGEKHSVDKVPQALRAENVPLHERHNLVFAGTSIVHGQGEAVVVQIGRQTELGRMAGSARPVSARLTPLGARLEQLNNLIAACLLGAFAITLGIGSIRAESSTSILHGWAAMAVALIPELLPFSVALFLVAGKRTLLRRNALVREPQAMETLGAVSVICTDQSGPLTEDQLHVDILDAGGKSLQFDEPLRKGHPILFENPDRPEHSWPPHSLLLAINALSATHASLQRDGDFPEEYAASGDPSEAAILVAAAQVGLWKNRLERLYPRLIEAPYTPDRGRRSALHQVRLTPHVSHVELPLASLLSQHNPFFIVATGEADSVLDVCDRVWINGHILSMSAERLAEARSAASRLESEGKRVNAIAFRPLDRLPALVEDYPFFGQRYPIDLLDLPLSPKDTPRDVQASYEFERDLIFVGLAGIQEEAREEAVQAILACRKAGIRPIMISSELPANAVEIARRLRISLSEEPHVLTGQDLDTLSDEDLERAVDFVSVFTQLSPRHRVSLVQALQRRGQVVAVTGEEDSDAPVLSGSDVGAAIATRERQGALPDADLVLLDGSFATLMRAVEGGRQTFQRVRQFLRFSLSRSAALLLVLVFAPLLGLRSVLTPLQALWLNLACDALLGLPLALLADQRWVMRGRDMTPGEGLLARGTGRSVLWTGAGMAMIDLGVGLWAFLSHQPNWATMVFNETVFLQVWLAVWLFFHASPPTSIPTIKNGARMLAAALALTALLLLFTRWSLLASTFELSPLSGSQLFLSFASAALILAWEMIPGLKRWLQ